MFVQYLLNAQTQKNLSKGLGWYGSMEPDNELDRDLYAGFSAMRHNVRARPAIPNYVSLSNELQRSIYEVLFDNENPQRALSQVRLRK